MERGITIVSDGLLEFSKITLNDEYSKKWNIHQSDFIHLTRNGELVRDTLYRIGGLNYPKLNKDRYFLLLKHNEAFYSDTITKIPKDKRHLESKWCILDINGNEKIEFDSYKYPYLVDDSCLYSIDNVYYNIETGERYGAYSGTSIKSKDFIFIENRFDNNRSKCGVMKISKLDGSVELFPM